MRSRNIKSSFYQNELLAELPIEARYLFIGLWCMADREGRLEDRPKRIGFQLMPYDDVDPDALLSHLSDSGFIVRYCVNGSNYLHIVNFLKHQKPHPNEKQSAIPPYDPECSTMVESASRQGDTHEAPRKEDERTKVKRTPADSLNPDILNPDSKQQTDLRSVSGELQNDVAPPAAPDTPPVLSIPLIKKDGEFPITESDIEEWQSTFPGIDVRQHLRVIRQWNVDNPTRRKTKSGIRKHITSWLAKEQNRARSPTGGNINTAEELGAYLESKYGSSVQ